VGFRPSKLSSPNFWANAEAGIRKKKKPREGETSRGGKIKKGKRTVLQHALKKKKGHIPGEKQTGETKNHKKKGEKR